MTFLRFTSIRNNSAFSADRHTVGAVFAIIILLLMAASVFADTTDVVDLVVLDSAAVSDTVLFEPPPDKSFAGRVTNPVDLEQHLTQNPTGALFKSMFVPGWGQFGNRRYTKAAVIFSLEVVCFAASLHYRGQANDARERYEAATTIASRNHWYEFYDNKRKNRNKYAWFVGITVFLSMFDAYVDAHLSGSPLDKRNDKISFEIMPDEAGGVNAQVAFNF